MAFGCSCSLLCFVLLCCCLCCLCCIALFFFCSWESADLCCCLWLWFFCWCCLLSAVCCLLVPFSLDCLVGTAGLMRRALTEAVNHVTYAVDMRWRMSGGEARRALSTRPQAQGTAANPCLSSCSLCAIVLSAASVWQAPLGLWLCAVGHSTHALCHCRPRASQNVHVQCLWLCWLPIRV